MREREQHRFEMHGAIRWDLATDPAAVVIAADECYDIRTNMARLRLTALGFGPARRVVHRQHHFRQPLTVVEADFPGRRAVAQPDAFIDPLRQAGFDRDRFGFESATTILLVGDGGAVCGQLITALALRTSRSRLRRDRHAEHRKRSHRTRVEQKFTPFHRLTLLGCGR